ncbi:MAG: hypothetical protein ACLFUJ_11290 [Phycisphaerae bacterium]
MAKNRTSARRTDESTGKEQFQAMFAEKPLEMPAALIATRTFSQRGRLLARGAGWLAGGGLLLIVAALLGLLRPGSVKANPLLLGVHLAWAASAGCWGLWCIHRGMRPALARTTFDATGVRQKLWGIGPAMKWQDVSMIELGDDDIRLRAGRGEIFVHTARNFVQRNEPVLARWWRGRIAGSGRRSLPLLRTGLALPVWWIAAGNALSLAAWMIATLALGQGPGHAAVYASCLIAAAGGLALGRAALQARQAVTLHTDHIDARATRSRHSMNYQAVGLISLNKLMLDFKVIWGEVELVSVAGRRMAFRIDGQAYENFSALIVRRCPRAFVIEHDTAQAAPPLIGGIENSRDRMVQLCRKLAIKQRIGGILAVGLAGSASLGLAISVHFALPWLAALCLVAVGISAAAAWQDLRRARHTSRTAFGLGQLEQATWEDQSVKPEDDILVDMVA